MVEIKLLDIYKSMIDDEYKAVIWLGGDNHPLGGDGEIIILEMKRSLFHNALKYDRPPMMAEGIKMMIKEKKS